MFLRIRPAYVGFRSGIAISLPARNYKNLSHPLIPEIDSMIESRPQHRRRSSVILGSAQYDSNGFNPIVRSRWGCSTAPRSWYCSPEFDRLHVEAATEPDVAKRGLILRKAGRVLSDEARAIFLLETPRFLVHSPKVRGFEWNSDRLWHFDNVYIVE